MTNAYTIPFLTSFVQGTTLSNWNSVTGSGFIDYASVLSPVGGVDSLKIQAFNNLFGGRATVKAIIHGTGNFGSYGITPRARLLKALKLRSTGVIF